jgi:hypothetical protein
VRVHKEEVDRLYGRSTLYQGRFFTFWQTLFIFQVCKRLPDGKECEKLDATQLFNIWALQEHHTVSALDISFHPFVVSLLG